MEVGLSPGVTAWPGVCHQCSVPTGENHEHLNDDGPVRSGVDDNDVSYDDSDGGDA